MKSDVFRVSKTNDDLFERVLERLEADVDREAVQKTMTALWASRAGLSESELLEITGLKPLEWAPIDISLQEALSEKNNGLVFTHDYMRIAIQDRYLPTDELKREAHSHLADWFKNPYEKLDSRINLDTLRGRRKENPRRKCCGRNEQSSTAHNL